MSLVRGKNAQREIQIPGTLHRRGYHYRLHVRFLPGLPDVVFASHKKVIFVHRCFWHRHARCKLERNRMRDEKNQRQLNRLRWRYQTSGNANFAMPARLWGELRGFLMILTDGN